MGQTRVCTCSMQGVWERYVVAKYGLDATNRKADNFRAKEGFLPIALFLSLALPFRLSRSLPCPSSTYRSCCSSELTLITLNDARSQAQVKQRD